MFINSKKTCCLRIGPRYTVNCCNISTAEGRVISWASEVRYLGVFVVRSNVPMTLLNDHSIVQLMVYLVKFWILHLRMSYCSSLSVSTCPYGLDACPVNKIDLRSLYFTVDRVFMKLFKTGNMEIVRRCQAFFGFKLPSVLLNISSDKFIKLYDVSDNVACTSLRVN